MNLIIFVVLLFGFFSGIEMDKAWLVYPCLLAMVGWFVAVS